MEFLRVLFAVIIPPVGVFLKTGLSLHFLLSLLLTLFGYFPGLLHAIWVVTRD